MKIDIEVVNFRSTPLQRFLHNIATFSMLSGFAYISYSSVFWSIVCLLVLLLLVASVVSSLNKSKFNFNSYDDLIGWAKQKKQLYGDN